VGYFADADIRLLGESGAELLRLLCELPRIGLLEPREVLDFLLNCWQLRKMWAMHELPIGLARNQPDQEAPLIGRDPRR
jgi:hypothetical protein